MTWFKVDDKLHEHRKAATVGLPAMGLWVLAGSWCGDNLTDGFVPDRVVSRWGSSSRKLAAQLAEVGLWVPGEFDGEPGWWFHDWLERNPSREAVMEQRGKAAERQARARDKARESRSESRRDGSVSHGPPDPTRPEGTPQPPAERGAEACRGQHINCRACGTTRRALAPVYSHPHVPYPIPDADEWIAEQRDIPVSRPPEGWREQMRSAQ
jgi:hypothetical protein